MIRCSCWIQRWLARPIILPFAIVLNAIHPFIHHWEGGTIDSFIQTVTTFAFVQTETRKE